MRGGRGEQRVGGAEEAAKSAGQRGACTLAATGRWTDGGVHEMSYTCTAAGCYDLHLWFRDAEGSTAELAGSPHRLTIAPSEADHRGTVFRCPFRWPKFSRPPFR